MELASRRSWYLATTLPLLLAAAPIAPTDSADERLALRALQLAELRARGELQVARVQPDHAFPGRRHLRYEQRLGGVPVFGAQLVEQVDEAGRTLTVFGRVHDARLLPDPRPLVRADQAADVAAAVFPRGAQVVGQPDLVLLPQGEGLTLAYTAHVRFDLQLERVFVDANTAEILLRYSDLRSEAAAGLGNGVWGDRKKLAVESQDGTYRAVDLLRPPRLVTYDMRENLTATNRALASGRLDAAHVASDSDNEWSDPAVVDAHAYAGMTYDYYYKRHNRRGLDDHDMAISSVTHIMPRAYMFANAFWDPDVKAMFYGDGDFQFTAFSGALDVVCHELTHGLTQFTWDGIYMGESGALNEALSDILATGAEFMHQTPGVGRMKADYYLGEDLTFSFDLPRSATRSLENPGLFCSAGIGCDADHYSKRYRGSADGGGVHHNSGIANHAFYLLAEGGVNRTSGQRVSGLGQDGRIKAERIFYRGFTAFLTPWATFHDAREATRRAARELYGTAEETQVSAAWSAVGVE